MATNASPYIVNIVELQNISQSITGTSQASQLSRVQEDIANIQTMVDYATKTVSADVLTSFTKGNSINILSDLNLSNASLYSNNEPVSLSVGTTLTTLSTIGTSNSFIGLTNSTMSFTVAGIQNLSITSTGMLKYVSTPTYFSTGVDIAGFLYVSESAYVKNLYQTSDRKEKKNIQPFFTSVHDVLQLESMRFDWKTTGESDIGFIAQDVHSTWPELTTEHNGKMSIAYSRFIPLLLESIRELNTRMITLEEMVSHLRNGESN